jgi:membrane protein YqaA with SNARE-associated domain
VIEGNGQTAIDSPNSASHPGLISRFFAPQRRQTLLRIVVLLAVIALTVYIYTIRDQATQLAKYGYPGIFLLSILANATILLPAPGILFVFAMGAVFNPLAVAFVAGAGAAIGELAGYLLGYSGRGIAERADIYDRILGWMQRNKTLSYLVIFILAFIPNPFFDLAGLAAGTLKIPVLVFLFFTFCGKTLKMIAIAYAGATSLRAIFGN